MSDIRKAGRDDLPALYEFYGDIGKKDEGYFEEALSRGHVFMFFENDVLCGFCLYNAAPRYSFYRRLNIPEIQDLNVLPAHRRKGIATKLIEHCESEARQSGRGHIGISVGLSKEFGPAQILYAKMGYVPDGNGVTYDREAVKAGKSYPVDDDLALMMVKQL